MKCFPQQPKRPTAALPANSRQSTGTWRTPPGIAVLLPPVPAVPQHGPTPGALTRPARETWRVCKKPPKSCCISEKKCILSFKSTIAFAYFKYPALSAKEQSPPSPKSSRDEKRFLLGCLLYACAGTQEAGESPVKSTSNREKAAFGPSPAARRPPRHRGARCRAYLSAVGEGAAGGFRGRSGDAEPGTRAGAAGAHTQVPHQSRG